jgi:hypothetical protein
LTRLAIAKVGDDEADQIAQRILSLAEQRG